MKNTKPLIEMMEELMLVTIYGMKSKNDDQIDNVSMLTELNAWRPAEVTVEDDPETGRSSAIWDDVDDDREGDASYFV